MHSGSVKRTLYAIRRSRGTIHVHARRRAAGMGSCSVGQLNFGRQHVREARSWAEPLELFCAEHVPSEK